jgi:RHS repeat-associated protein
VSDTVEGPRNAFTHDARGNLTAMIDGLGRSMRLTYDDHDRVTSVTDRDGARSRFEHDERGNLTRRVDPDGAWAEWAWDGQDRLLAETHRNHAVTTYHYTGDQRRPSRIVEPGGGTYLIELADTELPLAVTDPDGVVTRYEWDDDGQLVAIVDGLGHRTELAFDAIGMPVKVVDASGVVTEMTNDAAGRLLGVLVAGTGPSFEYTPAGRPTSGVDSEGVSWAATHGSNGKLAVFADGVGSEVGYEWDVFGNLAAVTAPDGARYEHRHDKTGALTAVVDPEGRASTQEHDAEGRAVKVTDSAGRTWSRTTDQLGRTIELTNPDGTTRRYSYHLDGQVSRVRHPDGTTVTSEVDDLGRIRAIVDEAGGRFEFDYTPAGRLIERRWPSGRIQRWTYDAAGRMTALHDGSGEALAELTLDPQGRVLAAETPEGRVGYTYDAAGEIISVTGADAVTSIERDTAGRVRAVVDGEGGRSGYRLDARGMVAEATDPAGLVSRFARDGRGRLQASTAPNGDTTSFGYDRTGFLEQVTDPNGTMRRILDPTGVTIGHRYGDGTGIDRTLDAMGRTTALTADGATVAEYGYDPRGRLVEARNPAADVTTTFDWDPAGRLTAVTGPTGRLDIDLDPDGFLAAWHTDGADTSVERDAAGRLVALDDSGAGRVERPHGPERRRDRAGRIIATEHGHTYRYDHAGRLAEAVTPDGERRTFSYGVDGLLERETGPAGITIYRRGFLGRIDSVLGPDGVETSYFYDSAGRRVGATAGDGTVTQWFWDARGDLVTIERRDAEGRVQRTEVSYDGLGRPFSIDGTPIAWDDALSGLPARIGERRYLHLAGRTRPAEAGSTWLGHPVDPWGRQADDDGRPQIGMHGHLAAAGLVWMGARIYDPSTREFLSPDPLMAVAGRNGSANVYSYGFLDPVNFADPSGMRPISQEEFEALKTKEEGGRLGQAWTAIKEDPWGTLAMGVVVVAGAALLFTPAAAVGAGILIGAAASAGSGIATGTFSPRGVALGGALGAIPGGNTLRGMVLVGAGTGAGGELALQATSGQPMNWTAVAVSTGFGAVGGAAARGVNVRLGGARPTADLPAAPTTHALPAGPTAPPPTGGPVRPRFAVDSAGNTTEIVPGGVIEVERYAPKPMKPTEATDAWDEFLGDGPHTNIHPRTGLPDANRIASADGTRTIRYGPHEMNSKPTKHHYHEETWTYDPRLDVTWVDNTVVRVPLK